jgi:hypothetical protein
MIRFPLISSCKRMLGTRAIRRPRARRPITARLEALEARTVLSTYTLPLVNHTGLNAEKFSIYVDGFATATNQTLQPSGTPGVLSFATQSGTVSSYKLGKAAGDYHTITFDSSLYIDGARIYFFVVPRGKTPPSFPFGNPQPANPPGYPYLYSYVELTNPNTGAPPTVDLSTVDGFSLPATLRLNGKLGQVGQPLASPHVNREAIIKEFSRFMKAAAGEGGGNYTVLELPKNPNAAGQSEGLLNPYLYLAQPIAGGSLPKNVASPLNGVFDGALNTVFGASGWSLMGTDGNVYTATAGSYQYASQTNPYTGSPLMLPGIQLQGGGNTFRVFNPVGDNVFVGANGQAITATSVNGQLNQITLTNAPAAGVLQKGMYVFGTGFDQSNGSASSYITDISTSGGQTTVTLNAPLAGPITIFQVVFGQLPFLSILQLTSGEMVFGNTGFFADVSLQGIDPNSTPGKTLGNLENQIVSAFNRGVAVAGLNANPAGNLTQYWGTETNWYPAGQPENLFSWFLHTAVIKGDPIYLRPPGAVPDKRGALMGMAYGFGYDENPGPVPPAPPNQPEVPSKFDPVPGGTTTMTVTLDPWFAAGPARRRG